MRRITIQWICLTTLLISLLSGCEPSGNASSSPVISAAPSSSSAVAAPVTAGKPFDNQASSYAIHTADRIDIAGDLSSYQVDASFFSDKSNGWLLTRPTQGKLALIHTKDEGTTWNRKELPGEQGRALFFADESKGFATVVSECGITNGADHCDKEQILMTVNGGESWKEVWRSADKSLDFTASALAFPDSAVAYALSRDGTLLVSRDSGSTWKKVQIGAPSFRVEQMSFISGNQGWVVGSSESKAANGDIVKTLQVWKSQDAGAHWQLQFGKKGTGLGSRGLAFYDQKHGYFALGDYEMMSGKLMRTADGGAHWVEAGSLKPARPTPMGIRLLSPDEGWIPLSPGAGPIEGGLLHFSKGGEQTETWQDGIWSLSDAIPLADGTGWAVANSFNAGMRSTVLKTSNGGRNWRQVWPAPHPITDVAFVDDTHGFGIGRESDARSFMRTEDGGTTWQVVSNLEGSGIRLFFADPVHGWLLASQEGSPGPRLLETRDGGGSWTVASDGFPGMSPTPLNVQMKFFHNDGVMTFQEGQEIRVLLTADGGHTWKARPPIPESNGSQSIEIVSPSALLQTSLVSKPDKTHWLQMNHITVEDGSHTELGKLDILDSLQAAIYPSDKTGAVLTIHWLAGQMVPHLLSTADGGRNWNDQAFAAVDRLNWDTPSRFAALSESSWYLLMQGHLIRTQDAGRHWTLLY